MTTEVIPLAGWPLAFAIAAGVAGFVLLMGIQITGRWPWNRD